MLHTHPLFPALHAICLIPTLLQSLTYIVFKAFEELLIVFPVWSPRQVLQLCLMHPNGCCPTRGVTDPGAYLLPPVMLLEKKCCKHFWEFPIAILQRVTLKHVGTMLKSVSYMTLLPYIIFKLKHNFNH